MSLIDANLYPQAAVMIHNGEEITEERQEEIKAIFLEGMIRFLDIYSQTEIGEGIQIDIMKVALHINTPQFINDDMYLIHSIDDVFSLLENLAISGLPIWRFLKLNEYQSRLFETGYNQLLISLKEELAKKKTCYGCIWYKEIETDFGLLKRCDRPLDVNEKFKRREAFEPKNISDCKWLTTLDTIPESILKIQPRSHVMDKINTARNKFRKSQQKDSFRIPIELNSQEIIDLNKQYDAITDLLCAVGNKRTYTERQNELRKAMYTEGTIRFFEMYAKCELGSDFVADIKNISLYIGQMDKEEYSFIKSFDDVYKMLEEKIISGFDVKNFIKYQDT